MQFAGLNSSIQIASRSAPGGAKAYCDVADRIFLYLYATIIPPNIQTRMEVMRALVGGGIVAATLIISACGGGGGSNADGASPGSGGSTTSPEPAPAPAPTPDPSPA